MSDVGFSAQLLDQWRNPGDILSVLLIVGADVISTALNQFNGRTFRPIAFSFGWVAYAFTFLLKTAGRLKLEPDPDCPHTLVHCQSGRIVENGSWLLGRMVKHFEMWMPQITIFKTAELIDAKWEFEKARSRMGAQPPDTGPLRPTQVGLVVSVFKPSRLGSQGAPTRDRVFWTGIAVAIVQIGIAIIPWALFGQWQILLVTLCGTLFAWVMGALQSRTLNTRRDSGKTFALTQGKGHQHAILIVGNGLGLDLEDLASDFTDDESHNLSMALAITMVLLWTAILITTSGMKSHTWYLLAIGGIGMIQNIYVAGARRKPQAYGMPLDIIECIGCLKVMETLYELERKYPHAGKALLPIVFPGQLFPAELEKWAILEETAGERYRTWKGEHEARTDARDGV